MNRLRIRFKRGEEIKFISHLDLIRVWQRALRRADIMLAYSEGFNPHPRLALAAPLALGVTGEAELMDVYTVKPVSGHAFTAMVSPQLPAGLEIAQVYPIPLETPTLQAQMRFAEYEVKVRASETENLRQSIDNLLARDSLPWQHQRDTGVKSYDLRKLIDSIRLAHCEEGVATLYMKLRCGSDGAGRPEQVAKALGLDNPLAINRTKLILRAG
jgi:radical SAM-linked protein